VERQPEPELMDGEAQARAYAEADFTEPHNHFIDRFRSTFPDRPITGTILDLGCGPADITLRFAHAFPECRLEGVDGAPAMLARGNAAVRRAGLEERVRLRQGYLPGATLPQDHYDAVISNSLLHHLADPAVLWESIRNHARPGAAIFVMDLRRPTSRAAAQRLVARYAAEEPEILRHDFFHSLLAAYRPEEVATQLAAAGLERLTVETLSDRHLTVHGTLPE